MEVRILGPGCPSCQELMRNAIDAAAELGLDADIRKVEDIKEILAAGVMRTPALMVNGAVRSSGRVPTVEQIKKMYQESP